MLLLSLLVLAIIGVCVVIKIRERGGEVEEYDDIFSTETVSRTYKKKDTGVDYEKMVSESSGIPDEEPKKKKITKKKTPVAKKRTAKKTASKV